VLGIVAGMVANDVQSRRLARLQQQTLEDENLRLRSALGQLYRPENLIGNSRAMRDVYARIHQIAPSDTTVLLRGEEGTGKELVASALHYTSPRAKRPLVSVHCAGLAEDVLEVELFGEGSSGNVRPGRIEQAAGGTLFLNEIGHLGLALQVRLLRLLQDRVYEPVGSPHPQQSDVRILCASSQNLQRGVEQGWMRRDLYYRLSVFPIDLPPLRERRDDILLLADYFLEKYARQVGKVVRRISTPAINMLFAYHWPGNVRELENCVEHAVLMTRDDAIHAHDLPPTLQVPEAQNEPATASLKSRVSVLEKDMITDALKCTHGNVAAAARQLGITPRMVRYKMRNLRIETRRRRGEMKPPSGPGH